MCTLLVTLCGLSCFSLWVGLVLMCTLLVTLTVACLVSASELALFWCALFWWYWPCFRQWVGLVLMCSLLVTLTMACLVQRVSWPCFWCALFWWHWLWPILFQVVSWPGFNALFWWHWLWPVLFSMWVGLVLMCTLLVTLTEAYLVSVCELAGSLMCTLLVTMAVLF